MNAVSDVRLSCLPKLAKVRLTCKRNSFLNLQRMVNAEQVREVQKSSKGESSDLRVLKDRIPRYIHSFNYKSICEENKRKKKHTSHEEKLRGNYNDHQ